MLPALSVVTVKLLFVLEARKLYKEAIEVVETTPFILTVTTPELAVMLLEVMILEVPTDPPTLEVSVFPEAESVLGVFKLPVVNEPVFTELKLVFGLVEPLYCEPVL